MNAWNVFNNDKLIDIVFYTKDCDVEYVRTTLINHDNYPCSIKVELVI